MLRLQTTISSKNRFMLDTIKAYYGTETDSETIRTMILQVYEKITSHTKYGKVNKIDPTYDKTQGESICNALGGQIVDNSCKFIKYDMVNPHTVMQFEQSKPLKNLSYKDLENQYTGGEREEIFKVLSRNSKE